MQPIKILSDLCFHLHAVNALFLFYMNAVFPLIANGEPGVWGGGGPTHSLTWTLAEPLPSLSTATDRPLWPLAAEGMEISATV